MAASGSDRLRARRRLRGRQVVDGGGSGQPGERTSGEQREGGRCGLEDATQMWQRWPQAWAKYRDRSRSGARRNTRAQEQQPWWDAIERTEKSLNSNPRAQRAVGSLCVRYTNVFPVRE